MAGGGLRAWQMGMSSWRMRMAGSIPMSLGEGGTVSPFGAYRFKVRVWVIRTVSSRRCTSTNSARMIEGTVRMERMARPRSRSSYGGRWRDEDRENGSERASYGRKERTIDVEDDLE